MANQEFHHYPEGESFAQHLGGDKCECEPRRTTTYKQRGSKQGHDVTVHYWHNPSEQPKRDIWDDADDAYAAHKEDPDNW